jgi:DNA modification methylase
MPTLPASFADAVITDPPFAYAAGSTKYGSEGLDRQFFIHWLSCVFKEFYRVSKPGAIWFLWGDWRALSCYEQSLADAKPDYLQRRWIAQVIVHDRRSMGLGFPFRSSYECIALIRSRYTKSKCRFKSGVPNMLRTKWPHRPHNSHPVGKSPRVANQLIRWASKKDDLVFDPFAGTGAILLAAKDLGRHFLGCEKDQEFYNVARHRLKRLNQKEQCDDK